MKFVGLILALGVMALGVTQYQRAAFDRTTSHLEKESDAVTKLNLAFVDIQQPVSDVIYELGGPGQIDNNWAAYAKVRDGFDVAFLAAGKRISSPPAAMILSRARGNWQATNAGVVAARHMIASGTVAEALAKGVDPFETSVWAPDSP